MILFKLFGPSNSINWVIDPPLFCENYIANRTVYLKELSIQQFILLLQ